MSIKVSTNYLIAITLGSLIFQLGCGVTKNTFYLQNIEVNGPVKQLPLHITNGQKANSITISPRISIANSSSIQGKILQPTPVNSSGIYQVDSVYIDGNLNYKESTADKYGYTGKNMEWNMPDYMAAFDIDYCFSNHAALALGANISSINSTSLMGWNAGIGLFTQKGSSSLRLDAGLTWQQIQFEALTVVKTEYTPYGGTTQAPIITFFKDLKKESYLNPYLSLTYNSCFPDYPVNFFLSLSYFNQTLFDFQPDNLNSDYYPFTFNTINIDTRGDGSVTFVGFTPGVYFYLNETLRISGGVKILKELQMDSISKSVFVSPLVQLDMHF
jgi:hypothetical protein